MTRLAKMMLLLAKLCEEQQYFGMVKLNKLLFYADMEAYKTLGHTITGEKYHKEPYGPVPDNSKATVALLQSERAAYIEPEQFPGGQVADRLIATAPIDDSFLSQTEREIVARVVRAHARDTGREISDKSHEFTGWKMVEMGENIPFSAVFIETNLTPEQVEKARALAGL